MSESRLRMVGGTWMLGGAALGAVMALPIGLAADGMPFATGRIIALCVGAEAGAVLGAIIGGGHFRVRQR
jgi:outer membrane lipoprotein SlyB